MKLLFTFIFLILSIPNFSFAEPKPVLSQDGYGMIKFGDKLQTVEKKLGEKAVKTDNSNGEADCSYIKFEKYPDIEFMLINNIIVRADGFVKNYLGLLPDNNFSAFLNSYKGKICKTNYSDYDFTMQPFSKKQCSLVIIAEADDGVPNIVFINKHASKSLSAIEYNGKIQQLRAGLLPYVQYKEGCL